MAEDTFLGLFLSPSVGWFVFQSTVSVPKVLLGCRGDCGRSGGKRRQSPGASFTKSPPIPIVIVTGTAGGRTPTRTSLGCKSAGREGSGERSHDAKQNRTSPDGLRCAGRRRAWDGSGEGSGRHTRTTPGSIPGVALKCPGHLARTVIDREAWRQP